MQGRNLGTAVIILAASVTLGWGTAQSRGWLWAGLLLLVLGAAAASGILYWQRRFAQLLADQSQLEQECRHLTQRLDYFFKNANDIILIMDFDGDLLGANDAAVAAYGYPLDELVGLNMRELEVTEIPPRPAQQLPPVDAQAEGTIETIHRRKDNTTFFAEVSTRSITIENQHYRQSIIRDISERKRAEEAARISHRALEASSDGILIFDAMQPSQPIIYVNYALERITGYSRTEVIGRDSSFLQRDDLQQKELVGIRIALAQGCEHQTVLRQYRKDGEQFWGELRITPVRNPQGQLTHLVGTLRDVTESRRTEEKLRLSEERYHQLFMNTQAIGLLVNPDDGAIVDANRMAASYYGYSLDKLKSLNISEINTLPKETLWHEMQKAKKQSGGHFNIQHRLASGEIREVEVHSGPVEMHGQVLLYSIIQDVTERRRAERALQDSEHRYRAIFDTAPVALWEIDLSTVIKNLDRLKVLGVTDFREYFGRNQTLTVAMQRLVKIIDVNAATLKLYQAVSKEQLLGTAEKVFGAEFVALFREELINLAEGRPSFKSELSSQTVLGNPIDVIFQTTFPDDTSSFQNLLISMVDITDRKRAEAQLQLRTRALEAAANGIVITDRNGTIVWANPAFTALTGYSVTAAVGQNPRLLKSGQHDQRFYQRMWDTLLQGNNWQGEIVNRRADGGLYTEYMTITPVRAQGDEITHFIAIKQDISERKRMEQSLSSTRENFRNAVVKNPLAMVIIEHRDNTVLFANPAADELFGCNSAQFFKEQGFDLPHLAGGDQMEVTISHPQHGLKTAEMDVTDTFWEDQPAYLVMLHDVTERKNTEAEKDKLNRQLIDASRQAGMAEVAAGVLHNVGNVLNSVNVAAGLVVDRMRKSKTTDLNKAVRMLLEHADDMASFLQNEKGSRLLSYFDMLAKHLSSEQQNILSEINKVVDHIEHIKLIISQQQKYAVGRDTTEVVLLNEFIDDILAMNVADRHAIDVIRDYAAIPTFQANKHKLLQVVDNLVRNAKQALGTGSGHARQLRVRTSLPDASHVRIEVTDNGSGINPENLAKIFHFGFTTKVDGHGFGLHSSANLAKEMGGKIMCHSEGVGKGATFVLELPLSA